MGGPNQDARKGAKGSKGSPEKGGSDPAPNRRQRRAAAGKADTEWVAFCNTICFHWTRDNGSTGKGEDVQK